MTVSRQNLRTQGMDEYLASVVEMDDYLASIDKGLLPYKQELEKFAVTSDKTLKFLRPFEVEEMNLPSVYKRMLIERIINLQTPDSKTKLRSSVRSDWTPKRLKFSQSVGGATSTISSPSQEKDAAATAPTDSVSSALTKNMDFFTKEKTRLNDEKDSLSLLLLHKKDEMKDLQKKSLPRDPLGIPGNPLTKYTCDNCHYKGHRAIMNKGNKSCPYLSCEGYSECGLDSKHPEHKKILSDVSKEIAELEKRIKHIDEELCSIKVFQEHNSTNFITVVRPVLKSFFPEKYVGKDGNQNLQRDLRYLKIASFGKIPLDLGEKNISILLQRGKSKVSCTLGIQDNCDDVSNVTTKTLPAEDGNSRAQRTPTQPVVKHGKSTEQRTPTKPIEQGNSQQGFQYFQQPINQSNFATPYQHVPYSYLPWVYSPTAPVDMYTGTYMYGNREPSFTSCCNVSSATDLYPPLPKDAPPSLPPLPRSDAE
ncbi:hypothetical protein FSP39_023146 [Pinctada imbricata]|uniref:Uncharacterized protein n=1 Tax=Pinctada imbricata TaxID=66713 RepID=A0AA88YUC5_PINIB|nr:hypothetical protein FSP39_023146 [Pinctada imbricata]